MISSSIFFIFAFLPVSLILYFLMPKKLKVPMLVLISLVFYAWGQPEYIVLMLFSIVFNYITGLEMQEYLDQERPTAAKVTMVIAVVGNLLVLGFFKYYGFLISNINAITGLHLQRPDLPLPLGISFYTFSVLSYVFDVYRQRTVAQKNILKFACYVTFFPKLISGPIVQYVDMEKQLDERIMVPAKFGAGVNMFLIGLFKKVLIADNLGVAFTAITGLETMSVGTAWLGTLLYFFQLYFDFSSYSDMAIGLAKMFGFNFDKNFDYPYLSSTVSEFWRRWHISLGNWFKQYVYFPLGGNRCSIQRTVFNNLIVFALTGLWHGANWTYLIWGLYHGLIVVLEKYVIKDKMDAVPKAIRVVLACFLVYIGWPMFFSADLGQAIHYYGQMFGAGHMGFLDSTARYYLSSNILLLIIAAIGATPLVQRIHQRLCYWKGGAITWISVACYVLLLILSVSYMMNATYTTFLYFQF